MPLLLLSLAATAGILGFAHMKKKGELAALGREGEKPPAHKATPAPAPVAPKDGGPPQMKQGPGGSAGGFRLSDLDANLKSIRLDTGLVGERPGTRPTNLAGY